MVDTVMPHHSFRETSLKVFDASNYSTSASNNSVLFFLDMVLDKQLFFLPAAGSFTDSFAVFLLCVVSLLDDAIFINYRYLFRRAGHPHD